MKRVRAAAHGAVLGARALTRQPLGAAAACLSVTCATALYAITWLAAVNVEHLSSGFAREASMIVYLDEGVSRERALEIGDALAALPAVERVSYVSPAEGLAELGHLFGQDSAVTRGLEPGMVPASLSVTLRDGIDDVARARPVVSRLESTPGVDEVMFAGDWVSRVHRLSDSLRRAAISLALLVAVACAWMVAAAVRLRLASSAGGEARAWALAGASDWFLRGPRAIEGAVLGGLGAAGGAAAAWFLFDAVREPAGAALTAAFAGDGAPFELVWMSGAHVLRLVMAGAVVGLVAGLWTGRRDRPHAMA